MWATQLRGMIAVVVVLAAIAFSWDRIENREATGPTIAASTTTTTTTIAPTATISAADMAQAICERAQTFIDSTAELPGDAGPRPVALLAVDFWSDVLDLAPPTSAPRFAPS